MVKTDSESIRIVAPKPGNAHVLCRERTVGDIAAIS